MVQSEIGINLKNQVTDESYSQGMVKNALLLMVAEKGRFFYGVIDQDRQKAVVLRDYQMVNDQDTEEDYTPGFFNRILEEDVILKELNPDKIVLSVYSQQQSLVPNPLFSKNHLKEILGLTCNVGKDQDVYADAISSANAHIIYGVPAALLEETGNRFKNASLFHAGSAFIESQIRLNKLQSEATVSVLIRNQYFDVVITHGSDLKLYNSYRFQSSEDIMYYLLFTMEQLQLNPDQVAVRCYGEIEKISSHWMLARKYIRNITMGEKSNGVTYSYGIERYSSQQYYPLFIQELCVS